MYIEQPSQKIVKHPRENREYSVLLTNAFQLNEKLKRHKESLKNSAKIATPDESVDYVVNIGSYDGVSYHDPCYAFYQMGYPGLCIEGLDLPKLNQNLPAQNITKLTKTIITPLNAIELFQNSNCPRRFTFLKIDIDGYDGPVLATLLRAGYQPNLIQVEINSEIPPPFEFSIMYDSRYRCQDSRGQFTGFYGMSFSYAMRIAYEFGYHLVHIDNVTFGTHDLIFARNSLAEILGSDSRMDAESARSLYLNHPLPEYLHFPECKFDSFSWRYRTDFTALGEEIWKALVVTCLQKHENQLLPFSFHSTY
jgi:hypothetical protein